MPASTSYLTTTYLWKNLWYWSTRQPPRSGRKKLKLNKNSRYTNQFPAVCDVSLSWYGKSISLPRILPYPASKLFGTKPVWQLSKGTHNIALGTRTQHGWKWTECNWTKERPLTCELASSLAFGAILRSANWSPDILPQRFPRFTVVSYVRYEQSAKAQLRSRNESSILACDQFV